MYLRSGYKRKMKRSMKNCDLRWYGTRLKTTGGGNCDFFVSRRWGFLYNHFQAWLQVNDRRNYLHSIQTCGARLLDDIWRLEFAFLWAVVIGERLFHAHIYANITRRVYISAFRALPCHQSLLSLSPLQVDDTSHGKWARWGQSIYWRYIRCSSIRDVICNTDLAGEDSASLLHYCNLTRVVIIDSRYRAIDWHPRQHIFPRHCYWSSRAGPCALSRWCVPASAARPTMWPGAFAFLSHPWRTLQ